MQIRGAWIASLGHGCRNEPAPGQPEPVALRLALFGQVQACPRLAPGTVDLGHTRRGHCGIDSAGIVLAGPDRDWR